ncbi:hypothetical protein RRG08_055542 [Elysia crispata]|uniref:Uncharacterized protein n=1 Tax=Elysia crispata TaxID=231223 RepID=A0AAE1AES2_9GAST|nr:hypothetical protein RRG08_055542 [Elysia crispata]
MDRGGQRWTEVGRDGQRWTEVDRGGKRWTDAQREDWTQSSSPGPDPDRTEELADWEKFRSHQLRRISCSVLSARERGSEQFHSVPDSVPVSDPGSRLDRDLVRSFICPARLFTCIL